MAAPSIQLTIHSDKAPYKQGEPIPVSGELKNIGNDPIRINRNFVIHSDLRPHFKDKATGKELSWLPPPFPAEIEKDSIVLLQPGGTLKFYWDDIGDFLSVSQSGGLTPGEYSLKMEYFGIRKSFRSGKEFDCFAGSALSNEIGISIKK